jgi:hypothetical protein
LFRFYDFKSPWSYKNKNKFIFELKRNFSTLKNKKEIKNEKKKNINKIIKNNDIKILFNKKKKYNNKQIDIIEIIEDYLRKKKDKFFDMEQFDFERINFRSLKKIILEDITINEEEEKRFYGQIFAEKLKSDREEWLEIFEGFTPFYQWYIKCKTEQLLSNYPKELVYYKLYSSEIQNFFSKKSKLFGIYVGKEGLIDFYNSSRLSSFMYKLLYNRTILLYFLDIILKKNNPDKFYKELSNISKNFNKQKIFNKFNSIGRAKELKLIKIAYEAYETLRPDTRRAIMKKFLETHEDVCFSNENQGIRGNIDIEFEERGKIMEFISDIIYKDNDDIQKIWRNLLIYRKQEFRITGLTTGFTFMDGSIIPSITFLVNFFCNELDVSHIIKFRNDFIDLINSKILKFSYNLIIRKFLINIFEFIINILFFFIGFLIFLYIFFLFQTPLYTKYIIPYIFITIPSLLGLGIAWTFIVWWTYLIVKRYNLHLKLPIPLYGIGYNIKNPMDSIKQLLKNIALSPIKLIFRTFKYFLINSFRFILATLKMIILFFFYTLIDPFFKAFKITLYKLNLLNIYSFSFEEFMKTAKINFRRVDKLRIREEAYNRYRNRGYILDKKDFFDRAFIEWGGFLGWRKPDQEMKNVLKNFGISNNLKKDLKLLQRKRFKLLVKTSLLEIPEDLYLSYNLLNNNEINNNEINNNDELYNEIFEKEFLDIEENSSLQNKDNKK